MKKKAHQIPALTPRDMEILPFIWKWKFVSTTCLVRHFFPHKTGAYTAYRRLRSLQSRGLIEIYFLDQEKFLWMISKEGFALIKSRLPQEMDFSYKSESPYHDYWVSTIHLGDRACLPIGVQLFSEQELRSLPVDSFPSWVPRTQVHRPDGYWCIQTEKKERVFALEVELSQKADDRYISVARFYRDCSQIHRVFWVVMNQSFAVQLEQKFKDVTPTLYGMHNFILLEDLVKTGWQAPIVIGLETGSSLAKLIDPKAVQTCSNWNMLLNLDCRKKPYNLKYCSNPDVDEISDRSASSASLINKLPIVLQNDLSSNFQSLSNNQKEKSHLILR